MKSIYIVLVHLLLLIVFGSFSYCIKTEYKYNNFRSKAEGQPKILLPCSSPSSTSTVRQVRLFMLNKSGGTYKESEIKLSSYLFHNNYYEIIPKEINKLGDNSITFSVQFELTKYGSCTVVLDLL